jgi:acyl carrier protein
MTKEEILSRIQEMIAETLEIDGSTVTEATSIVDDLGADSISIMEFTLALEDEFNLEISDEDAENIRTIGDVVNYVESHQG